MADKKTFGKKIIIKKYEKGPRYNMVYVAASKAGLAPSVRRDVSRNKTVIVCDEELTGSGAHISFHLSGDKIRYIANKSAIEKLGLKVAQELMRYSG